MPDGRFNEYTPQEQAAKAREWLATRGLPRTADNLNRAMMALMRGEDSGDTGSRVGAAIDRTTAPRRPAAPRPPAQAGAAGNVFAGEEQPLAERPNEVAAQTATPAVAAITGPANAGGADLAEMFPGGGGGSDAGSSMDPVTAAMIMLSPMAMMPIPGPQAAATGAAAAGRGLGVQLARPSITQMNPTTRMPSTEMARTWPFSPPVAGPAPMRALPAPPNASAGSAAAPGMPPALPGSGGAAARLPAPATPNPRDAAMQMATNPRGAPQRVNRNAQGPQRGQQAEPDNSPVRQPNTANVRRNPTRSLRDQLVRNRLDRQVGVERRR